MSVSDVDPRIKVELFRKRFQGSRRQLIVGVKEDYVSSRCYLESEGPRSGELEVFVGNHGDDFWFAGVRDESGVTADEI